MKTCIVLNSYDVFLEHLHQVFSHSKDKLAKNATILTLFIDFMYFYVFMYMYVYIYYFKFAKRYVPVVGAKDNIKYIVALGTLKLLSGQLRKAERYSEYLRNVCAQNSNFMPYGNCRGCYRSCKPVGK